MPIPAAAPDERPFDEVSEAVLVELGSLVIVDVIVDVVGVWTCRIYTMLVSVFLCMNFRIEKEDSWRERQTFVKTVE